jgi:hypothetical protein
MSNPEECYFYNNNSPDSRSGSFDIPLLSNEYNQTAFETELALLRLSLEQCDSCNKKGKCKGNTQRSIAVVVFSRTSK